MLSRAHATIFVHIPKTAGQSIEQVFLRLQGLTWAKRAPLLLMPNTDRTKGPPRLAHMRAIDYITYGYVTEDEFRRYFKFCFVRNPWDRFVSRYLFAVDGEKSGKTFPEFVDYIYARELRGTRPFKRQTEFILDKDGEELVDFIGRFENLQADFARVCEKLGLGPQVLPHANAARERRPYREYYSPRAKQLVDEMFEWDIERFGYTFDQDAGDNPARPSP